MGWRVAGGVTVLWLAPFAAGAQGFSPDPFKSLHALILPHADEQAWTQIPWLSDLWEARRIASEKGKPIFLWEMDGHPLGCT